MIAAVGVGLFLASFTIAAILIPIIERTSRARGFVDQPGRPQGPRRADALRRGPRDLRRGGVSGDRRARARVRATSADASCRKRSPCTFPESPPRPARSSRSCSAPALMLFVGWLDDRLSLSPAVKLAAQVATATMLVLAGVRITAHMPWPAAHVAVTILFVVFATNAANFIDNMNGLLVGVAAIAASCLLAIAAGSGQLFVSAILICLVGGLLAFLPRNFPHAIALPRRRGEPRDRVPPRVDDDRVQVRRRRPSPRDRSSCRS